MKSLSLSDAKARLSRLVDDVSRRDERVTITRNGRPAAVLVSPDEYESWQATLEILSDREFARDVRRGLRGLRRAKTYTLDDLFGPRHQG